MQIAGLQLKQQIIILEWFLKDHVTLKTGVMMLKIHLCHHRYRLHFKLHSPKRIIRKTCPLSH